MSWLISLFPVMTAGFALIWLLNMSQNYFFLDLVASWFVGSFYLGVTSSLWALGFKHPVSFWQNFFTLLLPTLLFFLRRKKYIEAITESLTAVRNKRLFTEKFRLLYMALTAVLVVSCCAILLHGSNTPTHTDDAVRVRAYAPMLVYSHIMTPEALKLIINNGIFASFVPVFSWQLLGDINHFYLNYTILMTFSAFILTLYFLGVNRGFPNFGILTGFLIISIPFFDYHTTSTYLDSTLAVLFVLSFVYIAFYAVSRDSVTLKYALLFIGMTSLVKAEGELIAATATLGLCAVLSGRIHWRIFSTSALIFLAFTLLKWSYSSNILIERIIHAFSVSPPSTSENHSVTFAAIRMVIHSLFKSGNFGIIFYAFLAGIFLAPRKILEKKLLVPLILFMLIFAQMFINGVFIHPEWTLNQTTIHRSCIIVALTAASFLGLLWA